MPLYAEVLHTCSAGPHEAPRTWPLQRWPDEPPARYCDEHALEVAKEIGCDYSSTMTDQQIQDAARVVRLIAVNRYEDSKERAHHG
jgi:hypothetical protein